MRRERRRATEFFLLAFNSLSLEKKKKKALARETKRRARSFVWCVQGGIFVSGFAERLSVEEEENEDQGADSGAERGDCCW